MLRRWSFGSNPFNNKKRVNFKKAVKISTYTDAQLFARKADAFFGPIYLSYTSFTSPFWLPTTHGRLKEVLKKVQQHW